MLALALAACGSATPNPSEVPNSSKTPAPAAPSVVADSKAGGVPESADSYPIPDCTGQDSAACAYDGFDPAVDGFGFANWGEAGNLGATELIALFGRKKVCASGSGNQCVLYPAAQQWAEQINEALTGGHCEGMAVTSELIHGGYFKPSDLDPGAETTFELELDNPAVSSIINYWFATQYLEPVQRAYQAFHEKAPTQIAAELAAGLQTGAGYTMGIYSPSGGHAITPIAVTNEGGLIAIHVYDNNFPGTVQRIMIDPQSEQWSYAMGSTNPQAPTGGWEGGIGTIELTPMESRLQNPYAAPFADTKGSEKTSQLLLTSPDPDARLGVLLTIDGKVYDTRDASVVLPAGVNVRTTLGALSVLQGNWTSMTIDRALVGPFKAEIAQQGDQTAPIPVTMSIDDPSSPRATLRAIADDEAGIVFDVASDGAVDMQVAAATSAEVNVSNGLNSANFAVPDGVNVRVDSRDANGMASIEFIDDEGGDIIGRYDLEDESDSGSVTKIDAEFQPGDDGEMGYFEVVEEQVEAEDVDRAWLELSRGIGTPSPVAAEEGDDNAGDNNAGDDNAGDDNFAEEEE